MYIIIYIYIYNVYIHIQCIYIYIYIYILPTVPRSSRLSLHSVAAPEDDLIYSILL